MFNSERCQNRHLFAKLHFVDAALRISFNPKSFRCAYALAQPPILHIFSRCSILNTASRTFKT